MNCVDMEPLILLMDSGEISETQKRVLMKHLSECQACRQQNTDLATLHQCLRTHVLHPAGPSRQTLDHIRQAAQRPSSAKVWLRHPWPIAIAAAASLALCLTTLHFSQGPSVKTPALVSQKGHAVEIIPLIAMITGTGITPLVTESNETELTVLANELLRLQEMAIDWPGDKMEIPTPPEDYQPTTLLWNSIPGPLSGRCV